MPNQYEAVGTEFLVNSSTSGDQLIPAVAALTGGGYIICWTDSSGSGGDSSGYSVKAQLIGADGIAMGGEFLVNESTFGDQRIPRVDALDNGGFAITWYDYGGHSGDSSGSGVVVRVYGADGTPATGEILVNTTISSDQVEPYVAGLAGGGFAVTWIDFSNETGDNSVTAVLARVFASDGSALSGEILVNTVTNDYQIQPQISGLANGNFVITWTDRSGVGGDSSNFGVKAQIFAADGSKIGGEFLVNTETANEQSDPTVTGLAGGGFVVTWNDHSGLGDDPSGWGIRAQIYDDSGAPVGGEFLVNTVTFDEQLRPMTAALPDGGFIVSWIDYAGTFGGATGGIKAQIFGADGSKDGGEFLVNTIGDDRQLYPDVAVQADGSFLITWISNGLGGDGSGYGVKAQIYSVLSEFEPEGSDGNLTVDANATVVFGAADFGFSDQDGDSFAAVRIATLPPVGTIYFDADGDGPGMAAPVSAGQIISVAELQAGKLSYQPGPNAGLSPTFTFQVIDDSGAEDQSPNNFTMTIEEPEGVVGYQSVGEEFVVNSVTEGQQLDPVVAQLDGGGFVVAWSNYDGIMAQRFAADGTPLGGEFLVTGVGANPSNVPVITSLEGGGFVIGWWEYRGGNGVYSGSDIKAQIFASDGTPVGAPIIADTPDMYVQFQPAIASLAGGGFVLSWTDPIGDSGGQYGIIAQIFDSAGNEVSDAFLVNSVTFSGQVEPTITGLAGGGFVIAWTDQSGIGADSSHSGVKAQIFAADGSPIGGEFLVNTATNSQQSNSDIAALTNGGFVVSWFDYSHTGGDPDVGAVRAQIYAADGIPVGGEFLVNTTTIGQQGQPSVAGLADGGFAITWMDGSNVTHENPDWDIRTQAFTADGSKVGGEFLVNAGGDFYQYGPRISQAGDGGFVIVWADYSANTSFNESDIKARIYVPLDGGDNVIEGTRTIDFNAETPISSFEDWLNYYGQVHEDGFVLDNVQRSDIEFIGFTPAASDRGYYYNGPGVLALPSDNTASLTHSSGQPFSVLSIDLDTRQAVSGQTVTFAGYTSAGSTVTTTFQLDSAQGMQTFYFPQNFSQLTNLQFFQSVFGDNVQFDNIVVATSVNVIDGTPGDDPALIGTAGDDQINGYDGHDYLRGGGGNDELNGGNGDDYLAGSEGDDTLNGDAGYDRAAYYNGATAGVTVDLNLQGVAQDTGQGMDTLNGIEHLSGTAYGDTLTGDGGDNWLWGSTSYDEDGVFTGVNDDTLDGGDGNDLLTAGIGNHVLTGGSGSDTVRFTENGAPESSVTISLALQGMAQATGNGNWTLSGIENLSGGLADDTLTGDGNDNILAGDAGNDSLSGGAGNDTLYGDGFINVDTHATGTSGPIVHIIDGGAGGNDTLEGGLGDDTLDGGAGNDTASYANASGGVNVNLAAGFALGADGSDSLANIENATGSEFDDLLEGNEDGNLLDGRGGNDLIQGWGGDDTIYGGDGDDTLRGDANELSLSVTGNDLIYGEGGNDSLRGGLGDDQLYGGANNDLLRGNDGVDYFDGGDDDGEGFNGIGDRVSFYEARATQGAVADLRTGIISNDGFGNVEAMVGIESLGGGTAYADTFYGNDDRNYLFADIGDSVHGFGGDDIVQMTSAGTTVDGGSGVDRLSLLASGGWLMPDNNADGLAEAAAEATSGWTVNLAAGTTLDGYGNVGMVTGFENVDGSHLGDTITGDGNNNVLNGGDGDDLIEGGEGDDTIDGGNGTDTASYANASGAVQVFLYANGGGAGESGGADGFDLLAGIENLTGSAHSDLLYGNNLANVLDGGDSGDTLRGYGGDDTLLGGGGGDFLNGGAGNDIVDGGSGFDRAAFYEDAGPSGVTVDLNLQGIAQDTGQGMDTLIGIENVSGSVYGDTLTGDDGDNWVWGSASTISPGNIVTTNNDTLAGGGGNDLLTVGIGNHVVDGGTGIDTFRFSENGAAETGIVLSLLMQGAAQASGNGNWTLTNIENLSGSIANDSLTGDGNDNVLAGDAGDDNLSGGVGNDTLYGDGAIAVLALGTGAIETIADIGTIGGVSGNDTLEGGDGDDQLYGGGGMDTASYASAGDRVFAYLYDGGFGEAFGGAGYDQLHDMENLSGSAHADGLYGNSQDNIISGGDGHDDVRGGEGNDQIYGGDGDDLLYGNGGDDLLDGGAGYDRVGYYSGATAGVTVDLNLQGSAQDTGQGWDTLVGIENVSGTVFDDTLTGDGNDNVLWGSASTISPGDIATTNNDTLSGGGGNDLLIAGIGNHVIDGGDGIDTFRFDENGATETGITLSLLLQGAAQASGNGSWTLTNIENLSGTIANDVLIGDGNDNVLAGEEGDDSLSGGAGNDTLYGDGSINWDTHGIGGSGPIVTTADTGAGGNDTLEGGDGDDQLYGGGGMDTASYASAGGGVQAQLYNGDFGEAVGAAGYDQLHNIENLTGSAHDDSLTGNGQDNVLIGGDGHDFLRGNGGNDSLYGGSGDDYLSGGAGDDLLDGGDGWDRVSFYAGAIAGVTADLRITVAQNTGVGVDTLIGVEHMSGSVFSDTLIGDDGSNWLWGTSDADGGNDTLDGQGGDDLLENGAGDHVIIGGSGIDTFSYSVLNSVTGINLSLALQGAAQNTGVGMMTLTGVENLSGSMFADTLIGDEGDNVLAGAGGDDTLRGGAGNDTLYGDGAVGPDTHGVGSSGPITTTADIGAGGNDLLEGGLGDDHIDGGGGTDTATYANAGGGVNVNLGAGFASGADGNDTLVSIENAIGSEFGDTLNGHGGDNVLEGLGGNDVIQGQGGNDTIYGGDGDDTLRGDAGELSLAVSGNDIIYGGNGNDGLRGGLGDDQLYGGANNDLLRGNGGVDYFDGGSDDGVGFNGIGDRVSFFEARATQGAIADLRTGIISNDGFGNVESMVGIESLGADTAYIDTFYGDDNRNFLGASRGDYLYGFGGDDQFQIGAATAVLDGGLGTDLLALDVIGGWLLPDIDADGLAESAAAAVNGWTVDLAAGTLVDGYGNVGSVAGIENVNGSLLGDSITGDAGANVLNGFDGDDVLNGRGGDDTLDGGNGTDTASYANAADWVSVDLGAGFASGGDGNDTLISIENLVGSAFSDGLLGSDGDNVIAGGGGHDYIRGLAGNDTLQGGTGDDYLNGGLGNDVLDGGDGWDRVAYLGATAGVTVNLNVQGVAQNTGSQGSDTLIGIEHVSGTIYNDVLTGDGGDNWLWGGSDGSGVTGNDVISAGGGNDLVEVGAGNHTLNGGGGNDTLSLWGNSLDISAAGVTFSLASQGAAQNSEQGMMNASGFENLSGSIHDDFLTGDNNANILLGDLGNDTLRGNDGDDFLYGDGRMGVDSHGVGTSGPITLYGDIAAVTAVAGGNDTMLGGRGNDWLYGGRGNDVMTGNQGDDRYVIEAQSGTDQITDFAVNTDKLVFAASSGVDSYSDLTLTKVGNSTRVSWGTADSVLLEGVKINLLDAGDFDFLI